MRTSGQIVLFRGYAEDRRTSMEIYADNLKDNLRRLNEDGVEIDEFRPTMSKLTNKLPEYGNFRMRVSRYVDFPLQARRKRGMLNHILDHGYAHLLQVLDPGKTIVTVHDVIPILGGTGRIVGVNLDRRRWLSEWTARYYKRARHIIASSESTKNDLVKYCGCTHESITVVHLGLNSEFRPVSETKRREFRFALGLPGDDVKLVLITGQEFYKNQATSIKVMERLQGRYAESIRLVRLGRSSTEWNVAIANSPIRDRVIYLSDLASDLLYQLYNAVDCLLFPSWYEGFGLPPVEAMASGTPVVTSCAASLPEVVGEAGIMLPPDNVAGFAEAITALFENGSLRKTQIRKGLKHVKQFDWKKNASMTMDIYKNVFRERRKEREGQ